MSKKVQNIVGVIVIIIGLIAAFYFISKSNLDEFDKNGLYKKATITKLYSKREVKTHGKGSWETNYYADLNFFVKGTDTRTGDQEAKEVKKPKKKQSLDEMIENLDFGKVEIGDYTTASLKISQKRFEDLKGQEEIEILYLKDNPERVILKELVDK